MSRDQRVHDNYALLCAQREALAKNLPLVVVFNLLEKTGVRSREHYAFMRDGLQEVQTELSKHSIEFVLLIGTPSVTIPHFADQVNAASIYFDFNPLRGVRSLQKHVAKTVDVSCTVVDAHNIIPAWVLSDKEEFAAHTIRRKVHKHLDTWLVEPPALHSHNQRLDLSQHSESWESADTVIAQVPQSSIHILYAPGESAARAELQKFVDTRLSSYASHRNVPTVDGQSNLSPYIHFGHISTQRIALTLMHESTEIPLLLKEAKLASYDGEPTKQDSINALLEELIVRKELADNYCFYNTNYDSLKGAKPWATETLAAHSQDEREYLYTKIQWEDAQTHDPAWNAAQREMMRTGKMHGYMRMYWAKKILEWSASPEEAIATAIYLNDRYSIDGGDPNGYTGIMWSIAGVHDRAWFERSVYGKIRYMNYGGLKRKFDIESYITTWN